MFYLLMLFRDREGHCDVKVEHVEDGWKLGNWLRDQREAKKRGTLDEIRQERLEEAGVAWDLQDQKWERMFQLLKKYKQREGHCHVLQRHKEGNEGENLGTWLNTQRMKKKAGKLKAARERQLDRLGIDWDPSSQKWERMFQLLLEFKEREGHCDVSVRHKEKDENLGTWLSTQKKFKRNGTLDAYRQSRLETAGVELGAPKTEQWDKMFELLVQYKNREGLANVPQGHEEDGEYLGAWLMNQQRGKIAGTLSLTRRRRLEAVGVQWRITSPKRWEMMFSLLVQYKKRNGHCNVPMNYTEEGMKLGIWFKNQRAAAKAGRLNSSRAKRLLKIGDRKSVV